MNSIGTGQPMKLFYQLGKRDENRISLVHEILFPLYKNDCQVAETNQSAKKSKELNVSWCRIVSKYSKWWATSNDVILGIQT